MEEILRLLPTLSFNELLTLRGIVNENISAHCENDDEKAERYFEQEFRG